MNNMGMHKYAIIEIAKRKDAEKAEREANQEHSKKIANSASRVRKALWKTHQRRNKK